MISWFEIDGKGIIEYLMTSKRLENYFLDVPFRVPLKVYYLTFVSVILGWCVQLFKKGLKNSISYFPLYSLVAYVFLLVCSTCIFRDVTETRTLCVMPFWSYKEIINGEPKYIIENLMNVVVFLPIGILTPFVRKNIGVKKIILLGVAVSFGIELIQLFFKTGLCEFDDIFHNVLGVLLGYAIYVLTSAIMKRLLNICRSKV